MDGVYVKWINNFKAVGSNVEIINKDTKISSKNPDSKTLKSKKEAFNNA